MGEKSGSVQREKAGLPVDRSSGCSKGTVERQKGDFLLGKIGVGAVGKDQSVAALRIGCQEEMKTSQSAR